MRLCVALVAGATLPMANVSSENSLDRIQAGQWVVASMYWEDKLVSTGKSFNPDWLARRAQNAADRHADPCLQSEKPPIDKCHD